jgi:hypothetical protein
MAQNEVQKDGPGAGRWGSSTAGSAPSSERRDLNRRRSLVQRVCSEFEEMPGVTLWLAQGARLFGIPSEICSRIFGELVKDGVLRRIPDGRYGLTRNLV